MTDHRALAWPPAPIKTERLVLRESEARDRAAVIELNASPEVNTYLGGPRPRAELERTVPEVPGQRRGWFVVELDGAMIGTVQLKPHTPERPSNRLPEAGETELGYLFLPETWGHGYATEACTAALDWFAGALPVSRWCSTPRPRTPARCASRPSWGSPSWNGSRRGAPSSGSGCGLHSRRPADRLRGRVSLSSQWLRRDERPCYRSRDLREALAAAGITPNPSGAYG